MEWSWSICPYLFSSFPFSSFPSNTHFLPVFLLLHVYIYPLTPGKPLKTKSDIYSTVCTAGLLCARHFAICISFLLLPNKWPQIPWLKWAHVLFHTCCGSGTRAWLSCVLCWGLVRLKSRGQPGLQSRLFQAPWLVAEFISLWSYDWWSFCLRGVSWGPLSAPTGHPRGLAMWPPPLTTWQLTVQTFTVAASLPDLI